MLECRTYSYAELSQYLKTNSPKGIKNKLRNYEVEFEATGRGERSTYEITAINNPFKVFAVFDLEVKPQTDIKKFAYFVYLILTDDKFCGMGAEMMEEHLRNSECSISRQTIANYLEMLRVRNLIDFTAEFVYYKVYKKYGVQTHDVISREEYSAAWRVYWECKNNGYSTGGAFRSMYNFFGGVPRKHPKVGVNGIYNDITKWVVDILIEDYGKE